MEETLYEITTEPISIERVAQKVVHPHAGAINTFTGTVRELTNGRRTLYLTYEAYESMALKQLEQIGNEIKERWENSRVAISHRIGKLDISDIAVVIAVSTPHRAAAFEACRYGIERLKEIVPIWKKEYWEDGEFWVGDQKETTFYKEGRPEVEHG